MERLGNGWRTAIFVYLLFWFVGSFWIIAAVRSGHFQGRLLGVDLELFRDYLYYGFSGAIGGSLYGLRAFHQHYNELTQQFVYWYLMRPVLCVGCAVMTVILFDSGILLLQLGASPEAKISVAFLTGFGYGKFMEKMKALTETLFSGEPPRDGGTGGGIGGDRGGAGGGSGRG
ncbi:hypothetical protein [Gordoniibacillus kamchatkensis]|uniref:hypothetical protein n=1 Tax=Gordoniibacillus kamchatkensis TaxID=1590651 RepID=UPI0006977D03|nr:hypothetical protein [Paenibacillus sp. VKM B-2647]